MADVFGQELLAKKNAIITGGGSGINLAIARRFATQDDGGAARRVCHPDQANNASGKKVTEPD